MQIAAPYTSRDGEPTNGCRLWQYTLLCIGTSFLFICYIYTNNFPHSINKIFIQPIAFILYSCYDNSISYNLDQLLEMVVIKKPNTIIDKYMQWLQQLPETLVCIIMLFIYTPFGCNIAFATEEITSHTHSNVVANKQQNQTDDDDDPTKEMTPSDTMLVCDSWEKYNRAMFDFNIKVDKAVIFPASKVYHSLFSPSWARKGVNNFLNNLNEPTYMLNAALQGNGKAFFSASFRFVFNTTFGLFGLIDWTKHKVPQREMGFASTLQHWGVINGNYVVLPVLGSSSFRGAIGLIADIITNPFIYALPNSAIDKILLLNVVHRRDAYDSVLKEVDSIALDKYVTLRSIYLQKYADQNPKCLAILQKPKAK